VREGRFELPGCDPERTVRVWFFDPKRQQGAVADIRGDPDAEPVVRLAPCRTGEVRIADPAGRPLAKPRGRLELVLRDGDPEDVAAQKGTLPRLTAPVYGLYSRNYDVASGGDGRLIIPWLIPGATYTLRDPMHPARFAPAIITVPPGQGPLQVVIDTVYPQ
jgi:hypothetical protein